jgi:hypothetical protein
MIDFDKLFAIGNSKINTSVKLNSKDKKAGMKIHCMEDYAQSMYDQYFASEVFQNKSGKDLQVNEIYTVKLKSYNPKESLVYANELNTYTSVYIPVRELINDSPAEVDAMLSMDHKMQVLIFRSEDGALYASERKCAAITYKQELDEFYKNNQHFTVKITELIDGGYIATYRGGVKCFLPGSQAAANVIYKFDDLLGKEIPVMIENFDSSNNLYIVSYKKYIRATLPTKISDLNFGKKYTGKLTAKPLDFGMFVEWDNYFTGLIHCTEFSSQQDYLNFSKNYASGSPIEFYIKDVTFKKGGEPRIVLTPDRNSISENRLAWQNLRDLAEGQILVFTVDKESRSLEVILPDDTVTYVKVDLDRVQHLLKKCSQIMVDRVDVLKNHIKFNFVTK